MRIQFIGTIILASAILNSCGEENLDSRASDQLSAINQVEPAPGSSNIIETALEKKDCDVDDIEEASDENESMRPKPRNRGQGKKMMEEADLESEKEDDDLFADYEEDEEELCDKEDLAEDDTDDVDEDEDS